MYANPNSRSALSKPVFPWLYLFLAYAWAWLFWIPVSLTGQDYQKSPFLLTLILLGVFGPGVAGIYLTYREQGKAGSRDFWQRVLDFRRIRPVWVALILFLVPTFHLISIAINGWLGGSPPEFEFIKESLSLPLGIFMVTILYLLQAGLEELGWRGYMLDRLQARWRPLTASLVLGFFHAFWHLPLFFVVGTNQNRWALGFETWLFLAWVISASIYATWCYNDNHRSTLAVILLHTTTNLYLDIFLLPGTGEWIYKILYALSAVFLGINWAFPVHTWKVKLPWLV